MKTCTKCGERKAFELFPKDKHNKSGYCSHCKECRAVAWANKPGRPRKGRALKPKPAEKHCRGCDQTRPIDDFTPRPERGINATRSRCRECSSKCHSDWRDRNPGKSRDRNLKSKYGISAEDYEALWEAQGCACGICGAAESGWATSPWMHVDHDHSTGAVRGLLCHNCNIMIGTIEKAGIDKLAAAQEWITRGADIH